jgi:hypothetical protein
MVGGRPAKLSPTMAEVTWMPAAWPGVEGAEPLGYLAADVAAEGSEPLVVQGLGHQLVPDPGDPLVGERTVRQLGVQESGQRGDDDVEGVGRVAAVACGVGQLAGDSQHLHEAARPPMRQD